MTARNVEFIDPAGLSALVAAHRLTEATNSQFQLATVSQNARRLISIGGLADLLLPDEQGPPG